MPIRITSLNFSPQTDNGYFICDDPVVIDRIFARLRNYDGQVSFPRAFDFLS